MNRKYKDLSGERFGCLYVVRRAKDQVSISGKKNIRYECNCDCGNTVLIQGRHLTDGSTKSCGCYGKHARKIAVAKTKGVPKSHGMTNTRLYRIWSNMLSRCNNPNVPAYKNYGARGISVCVDWSNGFEQFMKWATASGYSPDLTLDRISNDGNYCPDNCRWASRTEQNNNRRGNRYIDYNGQTYTIAELAREYDIPYKAFTRRLYLGWDIDRAISQPLRNSKHPNVIDD